MRPFNKLKSSSFLSFYGDDDDESRIVSLVSDYSTEAERMSVLKLFLDEGGHSFRYEIFRDSPGRMFFELWIENLCVGLLSVNFLDNQRIVEPYISISPLAVFILKDYQRKGYGQFMAESAGEWFSQKILKCISNCSPNTKVVHIRFHADFDSEEGALFFKQLSSVVTDYSVPVIVGKMGIDLQFDIDAGF
jgi:GNAT superfamily N-acetyltransferase